MGKIYGSRYARIGGTQTFWSGNPTFCQMGVLNSCFQNPSESSVLEYVIFKNKCCPECLDRYNFKKMDCQNHQFLGVFNAVQLYLHFEHKMVLLKLSEGHCSIVIMVNKLKLYCYWYRNNPQKIIARKCFTP